MIKEICEIEKDVYFMNRTDQCNSRLREQCSTMSSLVVDDSKVNPKSALSNKVFDASQPLAHGLVEPSIYLETPSSCGLQYDVHYCSNSS